MSMKKHLLATALMATMANQIGNEMMFTDHIKTPKFKKKSLLTKKQTKARNKSKAAKKAKRKNR